MAVAPRHSKMYKNSPKLERDEDSGSMGISRGEKESSKVESGTDGMQEHERHAHERREMKHRHMAEHMAMHHKHEMEHSHSKGEKESMHSRHEGELKELHKKHEHEHKAMHDKHEKEGKPEGKKTGEKKIEKIEKES